MSKTVLVITGSPHKKGNSDLMADAFIKGAQRKGHEVILSEQETLPCMLPHLRP